MHDGELWQVFAENGEPIVGKGATDDDFAHDTALVMGNSHVWLWRKTNSTVEILLQKRSMTRSRSPGKYHISAAGHVNVNETPVATALREVNEELGLTIDPKKLYLVHTTRVARHLQSLLFVFVYQVDGDESFKFNDGEVEEVKWVGLNKFNEMINDAEAYDLIDQGLPYFAPLIDAIKRRAI